MTERTAEEEHKAIFGDPEKEKWIRIISTMIHVTSVIIASAGIYFLLFGSPAWMGYFLLGAAVADQLVLRFVVVPQMRAKPKKI